MYMCGLMLCVWRPLRVQMSLWCSFPERPTSRSSALGPIRPQHVCSSPRMQQRSVETPAGWSQHILAPPRWLLWTTVPKICCVQLWKSVFKLPLANSLYLISALSDSANLQAQACFIYAGRFYAWQFCWGEKSSSTASSPCFPIDFGVALIWTGARSVT